MTRNPEPHSHDYRAFTATGELAAFLHRHNRSLIVVALSVTIALLALVL